MGMSNDKAAQLLAGLNAPRMASMVDASKGLQLGIQSFRNQQAEEGKRQSMAMANEYVSNLLGKGDAESIKQSRTMLPYADKQFAEQAQYMVHDIERGQDVAWRQDEAASRDARWGAEFTQKGDQFKETMARDLLKHQDNLKLEKDRLAEMKRHNSSSEALQAQQLKIQKAQHLLDNQYKKWGIYQQLDAAGYEVDKKTGMPVFTGKSDTYKLALKSNTAKALLDPTVVRRKYNDMNTFGGLLAFDSTTDIPTQMANELISSGRISPSESQLWAGLIATDPDKALSQLQPMYDKLPKNK